MTPEGPADVGVQDGVIAAIGDGLDGRRVVRLEEDEVLLPGLVDTHVHVNEPGRAETERDVEPVAFVSGAHGWYLIGWCRLREGPRLFRADRIRRASLLEEIAPARDFSDMAPRVPDLVAHALELG